MKSKLLYPSLVIIILLIIWWIIFELNIFSKILLPSPTEVLFSFGNLIRNRNALVDLGATLFRMIIGLLFGLTIGIPAGLIMGYSEKVYNLLQFIVDFLRSIPVAALIPLFLLFFGLGDMAKIVLVVFATSLLMIINTMYGVQHANKIRLMYAKTIKLSKYNIFKKIIFPEALPSISVGIRLAISLSLILVIVSEMFIGTESGLGKRIIDSKLVYNTDEMYATILLTGMVGYIINKLYLLFETKKIHWAGR